MISPKDVREALLSALGDATSHGQRATQESRVLALAQEMLPGALATEDAWELLDGLAQLHRDGLIAPGSEVHAVPTPMARLPWIHATRRGRALLGKRRLAREREERAARARATEAGNV